MLVAALAPAGCQLAPPALRGTVTADAGSYAGGVVVAVYANDHETLVAETASSAAGAFGLRADQLPAGTYRVRIGDRWWPDATSWEDAAPVTVAPTRSRCRRPRAPGVIVLRGAHRAGTGFAGGTAATCSRPIAHRRGAVSWIPMSSNPVR